MPGDTPFDAALAALDYQPVDMRDTGQPVYEILGLDDVRAAHRAEVDALSARVAKLEAEQSEARNRAARLEAALRGLMDALDPDDTLVYSGSIKALRTLNDAQKSARAALEDRP